MPSNDAYRNLQTKELIKYCKNKSEDGKTLKVDSKPATAKLFATDVYNGFTTTDIEEYENLLDHVCHP